VITKIPELPLSYGDAQPLLAALAGPVSPAGWRGNLPITYRVGPSTMKVHLKVKFNWDLKPIYDVMRRFRILGRGPVDHSRESSRCVG